MKKRKLSTLLNLSNQANINSSEKINAAQFNFIIMLGLEHLNKRKTLKQEKIPISILISKSGEIDINGLDEGALGDPRNIRIYADKKVTKDKEK